MNCHNAPPSNWKTQLLTAGQFTTFLAAAFGGLYSNIAPPDEGLKFFPSFASLLAGLVFLTYKRLRGKARTIMMWSAIALAVILPVYYFSQYQNLVVEYMQGKLISGTQYTPQASDYLVKHPNISKNDLVFAFGGKISDVWTEDSVHHARLKLGLLYSAGFAFLALAILTAIEEVK